MRRLALLTVVTPRQLFGLRPQAEHDGRARISVGELDNVIVVLAQAIAEHKEEFYTFVEEPGEIRRRKVKTGENNETHVQILDRLTEGHRSRSTPGSAPPPNSSSWKPSKTRIHSSPKRRPRRPMRHYLAQFVQTTFFRSIHQAARPIRPSINVHRLYTTILLAMRNLTLNKLRVLLTMMGLVFGVSSMIAMLAIAEGASLEAQRQIAAPERPRLSSAARSPQPMTIGPSSRIMIRLILSLA